MGKPKQAAKNPLRKLNKLQLLELLAQQEKELASLRAALAERDEELERRTLMLEEAGSIAEAALKLNGVFEAAQRAADQYLENIREMQKRDMSHFTLTEEKEGDA